MLFGVFVFVVGSGRGWSCGVFWEVCEMLWRVGVGLGCAIEGLVAIVLVRH